MNDFLNWLSQYSLPIVLLISVGAIAIVILKMAVEKAISAKIDSQTRMIELALERRSEFEQKVLISRFAQVTKFSIRFERIFHKIARIRAGQPPEEGFYMGQDVPELTELHGDLKANRIILSEEFYELFTEKEQIAWDAVNKKDKIFERREQIDSKIREAVERVFCINEIRARPKSSNTR